MLPDQSRRRLRLPVMLLAALLFNVLAISTLTLTALRGQQADIQRSRQAAWERALALLGSEVEHELLKAIQTPFLLLKNLHQESVDDSRLALLQRTFPDVEQVLMLTPEMALERSYPALNTERERLTAEWVVERLRQERSQTTHEPLAIHSFVEELDGRSTLFAFQSRSDVAGDSMSSAADGWIVLRFDLPALAARHVDRMLREFSRENGSPVRLVGPDDSGQGVTITLNRVLPGWVLLANSEHPDTRSSLADWHTLGGIGLGAGALISIALTLVAIWWEIRREHALVDIRNRFITSVSHELKTPLSLIRMYAETLYLERQRNPHVQKEYLGVMLRESERLSGMINDVLTFSKLRSGNQALQLSATDLTATISVVVEHYREHFASRGLRIESHIDPSIPPVAHAPDGVTQILLNLLENAARYAVEGELAEVRLVSDNRWVVLTVVDHGPGISHERQIRLIRAFRRGEISDIAHGSGLGLALVEYIAGAHGGHAIIENAEGHRGLKVTVSFPVYAG